MNCLSGIFYILIFTCFCAEYGQCDLHVMKVNSSWRSSRSYDNSQDEKQILEEPPSLNRLMVDELEIMMNALEKLNTSKCGEDISTVLKAIRNKEKWAKQMLDATPKLPLGLLRGNIYQFGDFDECIYAEQPFTDDQNARIQGKYCLADLDLETENNLIARSSRNVKELLLSASRPRYVYNDTIHWAICLPSSCTKEEVKLFIKEVFVSTNNEKLLDVRLDDDKCHVNIPRPFTELEIIFLCLFCGYIFFILSATAYHYFFIINKSPEDDDDVINKNVIRKSIICFSLIDSIKCLLKAKPSSLNLECTNGIRFITMVLILCCHALLFSVGSPMKNTDFYVETVPRIEASIFTNSLLYGDSFLILSGFLMSYLLMRKLEKEKEKVNIFIHCLDRYVRLTPVYLAIVFFYCSFMFRLGQGPLWDSRLRREQDRCLKSWWTHIIYLNNYINTDDICLPQSWQNAADYQLFVIAAVVLYLVWRWPKIGKYLLGSVFVATVIIPIIFTFKDKLDPTLMIFSPEFYDITENFYFKEAYIRTHIRANSYFVGVVFGYVLHKIQNKGIKIPKYVLWCGWITAAIFAIFSMFSIAMYYSPYHAYNLIEISIYSSIHKVAWCAALGWVILVCVTNNASLVNKLLSWKIFIPLSRLTYCAYLINGFVELYTLGTMRVAPYISLFNLITTCSAHVIMSFAASAFLTVFFEIPTLSFRNIVFKKG